MNNFIAIKKQFENVEESYFTQNFQFFTSSLKFLNMKQESKCSFVYFKTKKQHFVILFNSREFSSNFNEVSIKLENELKNYFPDINNLQVFYFNEFFDKPLRVAPNAKYNKDSISLRKFHNFYKVDILSIITSVLTEDKVFEVLAKYNYSKTLSDFILNSSNEDFFNTLTESAIYCVLAECFKYNALNSIEVLYRYFEFDLYAQDGHYLKICMLNNHTDAFSLLFDRFNFDINKIQLDEDIFEAINAASTSTFLSLISYPSCLEYINKFKDDRLNIIHDEKKKESLLKAISFYNF